MVQIGVADVEAAKMNGSSYEAVDLLGGAEDHAEAAVDEESGMLGTTTTMTMRSSSSNSDQVLDHDPRRYAIDSEEEEEEEDSSSDEDGSSSSSDSSDGSSSEDDDEDDDDESDLDLSEDESTTVSGSSDDYEDAMAHDTTRAQEAATASAASLSFLAAAAAPNKTGGEQENPNDDRPDVNSTADTEKHRNILKTHDNIIDRNHPRKPDLNSPPSPTTTTVQLTSQQVLPYPDVAVARTPPFNRNRNRTSTRTAAGERKKSSKEKTPPASTFDHKHRFKSFGMRIKGTSKRWKRHQRLPGDEEEAQLAEAQQQQQQEHERGSNGRRMKSNRKKKKNPQNHSEIRQPLVDVDRNLSRNHHIDPTNGKIHDPSQFPLEQYTDAEYGIRGTYPPDTYSFATADPTSIDYDPRPLRKMNPDEVAHHQQQTESEKQQRRAMCIGFILAVVICLMIMIGSIVAYEDRIDVHPPPTTLEFLCSVKSISTSNGHRRCERACKQADCCMAGGGDSCFQEQQEVCFKVSIVGCVPIFY